MTLSGDDRLALHDLVARYAALVDARDFTAVGELFTPDAVLRTPAPPSELAPVNRLSGRTSIITELQRLEGFKATFHGILGVVLDPAGSDADAATAEADAQARGTVAGVAHHVADTTDGPRDLVWHLRYRDRYQRNGGIWRFAERSITIATIETRALKRA